MVNTETPEGYEERREKETFQYQVPKIRAPFILKVVPDSSAADLPDANTNRLNETTDSSAENCSSKPPLLEACLPECDPHLPDIKPFIQTEFKSEIKTEPVEYDPALETFKPCVPIPPSVNNVPRYRPVVVANRSNHISDDDKDFEIPLEESLRAVEEFIKREKELSKWQVGEDVLAKWKGNGLYYKAKILEIFSSGIVVILFDSYDVKEEINYKDMCKYFKKSSHFKKKGQPAAAESSKEATENNINNSFGPKETICDKPELELNQRISVSTFSYVKRPNRPKKRLFFNTRKKSRKMSLMMSKMIKPKKRRLVIKQRVPGQKLRFF